MMPGRFTEQMLEEPIGRHARHDFTALRPEWSIAESLEFLRATPPAGRVIYFYVTTADGKLVGVVPTRRLLLSPPETLIRDIMVKGVVAIPSDATLLEALEFFSLHRLLAIPVVDAERKLVGRVDVELYTDELAQQDDDDAPAQRAREDVFQLIGVHLTAGAQSKPWRSVRERFPWLLCNVAGGLLAAVLSGWFDDVLTWQNAILALFVPLVLTLAESVAIQSVTLTLQTLRAGSLSFTKLIRGVLREATVGLMLGLGTALIVALVALLWQKNVRVSGVVFLGVAGGVTLAAMVGVAVPSLLRWMKRDPQVASGPVCLAIADAAALTFYFSLARWLAVGL